MADLAAVAKAWNDAQIPYAVTHGIDDYPNAMGRDLDLLARRDDARKALRIASDALTRKGYVVRFPPELWGPRLVAIRPEEWSSALEIHFSTRLVWSGVVFAAAVSPTITVGPFPVDPWAAWTKRVLLPLLAGLTGRFTSAGDLRARPDEIDPVERLLPEAVGEANARALLAHVEAGVLPEEGVLRSARRGARVEAARRHPLRTSSEVFRSLRRKVVRPLSPTSPVVALVGPDGGGKSTIARLLQEDRSIFTSVVVRHWRPALLPPLGSFVGKPVPQPDEAGLIPPRREAGRFEILRLLYYGVDFVVGHWVRDRVDSSHQRLVVYDRHAVDMVVDPFRFGLASSRRARVLARIVPKPHATLLVAGDPVAMHVRKPELDVDEIRAQLEAWKGLAGEGLVETIATDDGDPEVGLDGVRRAILRSFVRINSPVPR